MPAPYPSCKPLAILKTYSYVLQEHNCPRKCEPIRIGSISKIIGLVICMYIDLIANHWSIVFYKPREYERALEHIDVIVETPTMPKKERQIHTSCDATSSRTTLPIVLSLPCERKVIPLSMHAIYALNHPKNMLSLLMEHNGAVLSTVGSLR
jgi:hypothetical protein